MRQSTAVVRTGFPATVYVRPPIRLIFGARRQSTSSRSSAVGAACPSALDCVPTIDNSSSAQIFMASSIVVSERLRQRELRGTELQVGAKHVLRHLEVRGETAREDGLQPGREPSVVRV